MQAISQAYYHAYCRKMFRAALRHISVMLKVFCDIYRYILGISHSIPQAYLIPDSDI